MPCGQCDSRGVLVYKTKHDAGGIRGIVPCDCIPKDRRGLVVELSIQRRTLNLRHRKAQNGQP